VRRPRSRLVLRIYLAGLAQIGAVVLGFALLAEIRRRSDGEAAQRARASVEAVVAGLGDAAAVARELSRIERDEGAIVTVTDDAGRVLASNRREGEGPPLPAHGHPPVPTPGFEMSKALLGPPPGHPMPALIMPVRLPDGSVGRAVYTLRSAGHTSRHALGIVALVLVVVGVASLLTARSLARPLARLSCVARAFGAGQLDARVAMTRSDEIGDVASAFDEMADRLTTLIRAEKELLANVSHELRTPLARIRVALDLASEGDAATAREALGEIAEDLAELERLIGDVLTTARLDLGGDARPGGVPPLRAEAIDLAELLERAASRFRSAHPGRPLVVALAPDLPAVLGDPILLRRAVDNLLENAHRYGRGADDAVELTAERRPSVQGEEGAAIEVRDHGIGIAPEDLPHVFQPFFRTDRSRARATGGLGLGLALARRIVEAHHGTIALESALDEGTRARVELPGAALHNR
jgi:signal transduction histidine kinase